MKTQATFGTYNPVSKAEADSEGLHDESIRLKDFIKFQQLAAHVSGVMQTPSQATIDLQTYQR